MPTTERLLPILLGQSEQKHAMARATIIEEPRKTTITIVVEGTDAQDVAGFITTDAPIALSFAGIPVQPRSQIHTKEQ